MLLEREGRGRKEEHSRDDVEWPPRTVCQNGQGERETDPEDIRDLKKAGWGRNCRRQFNKSQQHLFKSISQNNGN